MTFVVPFDGSELAEAALIRAVEYGNVLNEGTVVVSIIPERKRYAQEKGWIDEDDEFDIDSVIEDLRRRIKFLAPEATFEYKRIREYPPAREIANHINQIITEEHNPSVVFLGSENVGSVVTPLTSIAANIATEVMYDVHIVRSVGPPKLDGLESHSEFYDEEGTDQ